MATYDTIGATYTSTRRPDPRIAARIHAALGDAETVINIGAGTGSYEPAQTVLAVEPSAVMIAQRPAGSAPAVQAAAESIPLRDDAADAVMALLTVHHWTDLEAGIAEMRRVARRRVVVLSWDQSVTRESWLLREYLPGAAAFDDARAIPLSRPACRGWPTTCPPAAGTTVTPTCSPATRPTSATASWWPNFRGLATADYSADCRWFETQTVTDAYTHEGHSRDAPIRVPLTVPPHDLAERPRSSGVLGGPPGLNSAVLAVASGGLAAIRMRRTRRRGPGSRASASPCRLRR
jgi:SAM-dependent methyltransferase